MSRDADARTEQDRLRQEYKIRIVVVARPISIIDQNKSMCVRVRKFSTFCSRPLCDLFSNHSWWYHHTTEYHCGKVEEEHCAANAREIIIDANR